MSKSPDANVPVEQLRHRKIKAAVWRNSSATGPFYTVTISRSFKKDEVWHDTQSFRYDGASDDSPAGLVISAAGVAVDGRTGLHISKQLLERIPPVDGNKQERSFGVVLL